MKKLLWFAFGITLGVVAVKQLNENPQARVFADETSRRAKAFGAAVSEGFREREAELERQNSN